MIMSFLMEKMIRYLFSVLLITTLCRFHTVEGAENYDSARDRCFCKLKGEIDDCSCKVENVDSFNNLKIYPVLRSLTQKDYFRYFKVNINKPCAFWENTFECSLRDCHVEPCTKEQLPEGLKGKTNSNEGVEDHAKNKYKKEAQDQPVSDCTLDKDDYDDKLGFLDQTISQPAEEAFKSWKQHDDQQETFCEIDDENAANMQYVDLLLNPERFTGYKGQSAQRIWSSIYNENCFKPLPGYGFLNKPQSTGHEIKSADYLEGLCLEKRVFFRMISGLHTSISVHLTYNFFFPGNGFLSSGHFAPNVDLFQKRFDPATSDDEGPQRLRNLYFTYLVELRALAKIAPYLEEENFYTGNEVEDAETKEAVINLLNIIKSFPEQFDESKLFTDDTVETLKLKEDFRQKFHNISKIMDCVGCDKCRLWGKLQTVGMGTALKILFSGDVGPDATLSASSKTKFQLRRTEIVALFNAFARLSSSIHAIEEFRKMMR
ncbi:ERO1-like protein alpha isoform X2 [Lineus longissimus]|uniref:ERO1-like protein alpha isoform X2 n=1 Tax=Lineus longissimus TaxID=88925 RepID=UPI00315D4174